ncbi:MAG: phospholipid scramblase-related protein [Acidimicrobiia bacterium]
MSTPANWYPDPTGRHQHRYWDGNAWTSHVSNNGVVGTDPPTMGAPSGGGAPVSTHTPDQIQRQVQDTSMRGAGIANSTSGGGTLFDEPILVVNQKAKLIEVTNQYAVYNQAGMQIASVSEVGQSTAKKALRVLTSLDQFMTHRLEIRDMAGGVIMSLTRPAKVFKSTVVVNSPTGGEIGRIVQENMVGKIHFALESGGQTLGHIRAENWRAWNFRIEDGAGTEVARITKTWEGIAKTMFTTADNYVVQLHTRLPQPLLTLVVASALSVDTALKQDARGLG